MNYVDAIFYGADGNGESETGSADAVRFTPQILTPAQQTQARENIGGEAAARIVQITGSEATITPEHNCVYQCGSLNSLTVSDPPEKGAYSIVFRSDAVAPTTYLPAALLGLERFAVQPYTLNEINVLDGRALAVSWPLTSEEAGADA
ncbi:MAG: hypothetical protein IKO68_13080 [Oscillospiraceae bacterium]|nr:hypothetical protein [Oscillospiraceae bacterium]